MRRQPGASGFQERLHSEIRDKILELEVTLGRIRPAGKRQGVYPGAKLLEGKLPGEDSPFRGDIVCDQRAPLQILPQGRPEFLNGRGFVQDIPQLPPTARSVWIEGLFPWHPQVGVEGLGKIHAAIAHRNHPNLPGHAQIAGDAAGGLKVDCDKGG